MRRQSDLDDIYGVKQIKSNPLDRDNEVPEIGFRHSDTYHRYFRGYTEIRREKPNGGYRVDRYYTQPWIVSTAPVRDYWLTRLMYAVLVILSWGLYLCTLRCKRNFARPTTHYRPRPWCCCSPPQRQR